MKIAISVIMLSQNPVYLHLNGLIKIKVNRKHIYRASRALS